jgi:DNA segregation ATPase FtsK/SpoIIIE and related proteins
MLAKRKRKKNAIGSALKYEVYGILLITLSVIAMSGQGWPVDLALSNLFGLFFGDWYFVVPLAGIYVGLATMIKRKWPNRWTSRMTGIALMLLFLMLRYTWVDVELKMKPLGEPVSVSAIMMHARDIRELATPGEFYAVPIIEKNLSGGYIGALAYALLFFLFGTFGAKFVSIVLLMIGIMLATGKSYVELALMLRRQIGRFAQLIRLKLADSRRRRPAPGQAAPVPDPDEQPADKPAQDDSGSPLILIDDEDLIDDDETFVPRKPAGRRRTLFFPWRTEAQPKRDESPQPDAAEAYPADANALVTTDEMNGEMSALGPDTGATTEPEPADGAEADGRLPWQPEPLPPEVQAGLPEADAEPREDADAADEPPRAAASASPVVRIGAKREEAGDDGLPEAADALPPKPSRPYLLPPLSLLSRPQPGKHGAADHGEARRKLEATLESFGVKATVLDVVRGPAVTRYEVQPAAGVKVSRIVSLTDDIALALAAKDIRMEAPIPGKSAIGIEVPNTEVATVTLREVMESPVFQNAASKLSVALGRDISGQPIVADLARMPHLLVAGATGSGKSVCINGIITSVLYKAAPDEVKFLMVDPKMVELNVYNGIPHLLAPVVTDPRRASLALKKIVVEMEKRYEAFSKTGTRNIEGYNAQMKDNPDARLPYIVVIVDELADLMMVAASDVEDAITRLAQMARAAGIHLIIATQRPSVDVITGVIKANIPSRIAFGVSSQVDSRTILDMAGAEKLLGRGDMLFLPVGMSKPIRVQGAFLSDQEVEAVVQFARDQAQAEYKEDLVPEVDDEPQDADDDLDELFDQAVQVVVEAKQASVSLLQRRMRIGYARAARLIDQMEARGIVGPYEGSKPREVLISEGQYPPGQISS